MKKLLLMLVVSLCAIAWRSENILDGLSAAGSMPVVSQATISAEALTMARMQSAPKPMSAEEFAELSKNDPKAYQKFLASRVASERTEIDKLMNFLARGKYE